MLDAYDWVGKNGILTDSDYPVKYLARKGDCKTTNEDTTRFFITDQKEEDEVSNERMKELLQKQPLGVAIHSGKCLSSYSKGIIKASDCECNDPKKTDVNHGVTLVGYGKSDVAGCSEYWLIRNSWGSQWGDKGFFKFCADKGTINPHGTCLINSYV